MRVQAYGLKSAEKRGADGRRPSRFLWLQRRFELPPGAFFIVGFEPFQAFRLGIAGARSTALQAALQHGAGFRVLRIAFERGAESLRRGVKAGAPPERVPHVELIGRVAGVALHGLLEAIDGLGKVLPRLSRSDVVVD